MTSVVLVAPFLLPSRIRIDRVLARGGFGGPDQPLGEADLLVDDHQSQGAIRIDLLTMRQDLAGRLPAGCDQVVDICLDARSVGVITVRCDPGSMAELDDIEPRITTALNAELPGWVAELLARLPVGDVEPAPDQALPGTRVLWLHRIAAGPLAEQAPPAAQVYGARADFGPDGYALVGNGYTALHPANGAAALGPSALAEAVEGIIAAQIDWLMLDELNRELSGVLVDVSKTSDHEMPHERAMWLERRVELLMMVRDERVRYLANGTSRVMAAAEDAWQTGQEAAALSRRAQAIRDLSQVWQARRATERDEQRNRIIWILTVIVALQSMLAVFDFITGDRAVVHSWARVVLGAGFLLLAGWLMLRELRAIRAARRHPG